jgi:hypothetical protein
MQISKRSVSFTNQNKTHRNAKLPLTLVVWYKAVHKLCTLQTSIISLARSSASFDLLLTITIPDGGPFWEVGYLPQALNV